MQTTSLPAPLRVLNELDHARLSRLLGDAGHPDLRQLLDEADLVAPAEMPPDRVTMRSRVCLSEPSGTGVREITLSYPAEADVARGEVSVLSPLGTALLGRSIGELVGWVLPDGRSASLRLKAMLFQPEAEGDYLR